MMVYFAIVFLFGIFVVCILFVSNVYIKSRRISGLDTAEIRNEVAVFKDIFSIFGIVSILLGGGYWLAEFSLKQKAEDRQVLYGALGQLIEADDKRPEISAAALLQFVRIAERSTDDRAALIRIVAAYVNEKAQYPLEDHNELSVARADIQVAMYVISKLLDGNEELGKLVVLNNIDLRLVDMSGLKFANVTIANSYFIKSRLQGTDFSKATLTGSSFNDAYLSGALLSQANIDLTKFEGADVSLVDFCAVSSRTNARLENLGDAEGALCLVDLGR